MSGTAQYHRRVRKQPTGYVVAEGFSEVRPGVYEPDGYVRSKYELTCPDITNDEVAAQEYARCAQRLVYFALMYCWSVDVDDPSGIPQWRKIPSYPYLRQFFIDNQVPSNALCEKSRQMLMSWAWMVVFLWDITFHDNWNNILISRRETEVDDGGAASTHNSLIGKVRHIWMALPPFLQQPLEFKQGMVLHANANSFIKGETGTTKAARGAAAKRALVDEAAFVEHSETVFKSVHHVAKNGTILNSTANGTDNVFARIRFSKTTTFKKITLKWVDHPVKADGLYCTCGWESDGSRPFDVAEQFRAHDCGNAKKTPPEPAEPRSPWYDRECRDLTPEQVASEIDISYEKSTRGRVYKMFDSTRQTFDHTLCVGPDGRPIGPVGDFELVEDYRQRYLEAALSPGHPCVVGWDFGVSDPTSLVLGQVMSDSSMTIRWLDEFEMADKDWEFFHAFVMEAWAPVVKRCTHYSLMHYGDPAGKNRESDLESWISNLRNFVDPEKRIVVVHEPKMGSRLDWLNFVNDIFRTNVVQVSTWCAHLIDALQNYKFPTDPNTGEPIPGKQEPVHDKWSHACSAFRYVYQFRYHQRLRQVRTPATPNKSMLSAGKGQRLGSARAVDGRA